MTAFEEKLPPWEVGAEVDFGGGTVAVNCCVSPALTFAEDGLILIPRSAVRLHPERNEAANRRRKQLKDVLGEVFSIRIIESLTESFGMSDRANAE
jgi:hypothetical protein